MSEKLVRGELGSVGKCRVTGIDGVVVARTEYLYRSTEVALSRAGVNHDGQPWDLFWIDEERLA